MPSRLESPLAGDDGTGAKRTSEAKFQDPLPSSRRRLLELDRVSVHYGVIRALDGVSLGLDGGEIVAVMGPNGAGKSTVLKSIMGLAPVVSGHLFWRQEVLEADTHEIVGFGISFVPQGRRVFVSLTVEENLEMGCLDVRDDAEMARRMDAVMEIFPILHDKRRDSASAMSGGEQQMLAVGRGLMAEPKVLLMDEPSLGLAPKVVEEMFEKIVAIHDKRRTAIMIVEHNIRSVMDIAHRAYVLDKGKVVHDGIPDSVRETNILTQVFLGET